MVLNNFDNISQNNPQKYISDYECFKCNMILIREYKSNVQGGAKQTERMGTMRNQRWDEFLFETMDESELQFNKAVLRHQSRIKKRWSSFSRLPQRRRETLFNQPFFVRDGN